jgi:hypothetical protein
LGLLIDYRLSIIVVRIALTIVGKNATSSQDSRRFFANDHSPAKLSSLERMCTFIQPLSRPLSYTQVSDLAGTSDDPGANVAATAISGWCLGWFIPPVPLRLFKDEGIVAGAVERSGWLTDRLIRISYCNAPAITCPLPVSSETLRVSFPRIHQYAAAIGPGNASTSSAISADDGVPELAYAFVNISGATTAPTRPTATETPNPVARTRVGRISDETT